MGQHRMLQTVGMMLNSSPLGLGLLYDSFVPWSRYLAFNAVHSANYEHPLQAPQRYIEPFLKTIVPPPGNLCMP